MVLNKLKKVRNDLKNSADNYDAAVMNIAAIAAEELINSEQQLQQQINERQPKPALYAALDKQFFLNRYGSLKNAKAAYNKIYGKQNYGRSWSDFINVAKKLDSPLKLTLTLEERIAKIENFLITLGYQP